MSALPVPTEPSSAATPPKPVKDTQWRRAWRQLRRNRMAMVCFVMIALYILSWLVAEVVYWRPHAAAAGWAARTFGERLSEPTKKWLKEIQTSKPRYLRSDDNKRNMHSTLTGKIPDDWKEGAAGYRFSHVLGTDFAGRDNLSRLMQGGRIAFELAILVAIITIGLGFTLGAMAGYFGGWVDDIIVYIYSVFASVPDILLIIAITYVTKQIPAVNQFYLLPIAIGMGMTGWVGLCRLIRAEFIKLRERPYVMAAQSLGASHTSIMFKHIAPNVMHIIVITFTLRFPGLVMAETVLTYLGIGIQTEPSWGAIINDARQRLWVGNWWEIGGVTAVMFFFVLALNLFGDALRDALDPKLHTAESKK